MNGDTLMHTHPKNDKPLISIITPAYNAARFITETIESVRNQTYNRWEMIIVDDASTDDTIEIVRHYMKQDNRITLINLEKNEGCGVARNQAFNAARGRFIAFLDSDDIWLPEKLEKQISFMLRQNTAFSFTEYQRLKTDGSILKSNIKAPETIGYHGLLKHCVIGCLTVMIDIKKTGSLQMVKLRARQDYVLWLTLTKRGFLAYGLPEELAIYRMGKRSVSSNKLKMAKQNWHVYRKIEGQGFLKSFWYLLHYAFHYTGRIFPKRRDTEKKLKMNI